MKFQRMIFLLILGGLFFSCAKKDDEETTTVSLVKTGDSINTISAAMASVASVAATSSLNPLALQPTAGVANDYCSATGGPMASGSAVNPSSENYASAVGYCQATFNAQSPDTARGAMYIAGGVACEAQQANALDNLTVGTPSSTTLNITFSTTCWGSQAEVDQLVSENGSTLEVAITVNALDTSSSGYQYSITYNVGGESTIYLYSSATSLAAMNVESDSAWAVHMDLSDGVVYYEGIDGSNGRRVRLRVAGTVATNKTFSAISSVEGFHMQGSSGTQVVSTYKGDLSAGFVGSYYSTASADSENNCYLPTMSSATCSGVTGISSSDANATSLYSSISAARTTMAAYTSSRISFTSVDPADTDVTQ